MTKEFTPPAPGSQRVDPTGRICCNCLRSPARARGRCHACYQYLFSTGRERPLHLLTRHCLRCGGGPVHAWGRCAACYLFVKRAGHDRPRWLFDPDATCRNPACLRPLQGDPHTKSGYCSACYVYRQRTGQQRPARLTSGPGPWCDCGARAGHRLEVRVGSRGRAEVLDLCEGCWRLECGETAVHGVSSRLPNGSGSDRARRDAVLEQAFY